MGPNSRAFLIVIKKTRRGIIVGVKNKYGHNRS
jgi:hypothetical protein